MNKVRDVELQLNAWKESLCKGFAVGGLFTRNRVAHKWKAPFRSLLLRECVAWRAQDLLSQSLVLHDLSHALGARILLRSALETIAVLIYLNQLTRKVLESKLSFHEFGDKTSRMLLGSRNQSTGHVSINIVTVLAKCRNRYPLIEQLYAELSESAHPNYEGMSVGYSTIDRNEHSVSFSNKLMHMYGSRHVDLIGLCLTTFLAEYDEEWPAAFEELERWIAENDVMLEATKNSKLEGGDEPHRT